MPEELRPVWDPRYMKCLKCENQWRGWMPMNVPVEVFVVVLKVTRCPSCGAGSKHVSFDRYRERVEAGGF